MFLSKRDFENTVIEAIDAWLNVPGNLNRWVTAKTLHDESKQLVLGNRFSPRWPDSVKTMGRRMMYLTEELIDRFGMNKRISKGYTEYRFGWR